MRHRRRGKKTINITPESVSSEALPDQDLGELSEKCGRLEKDKEKFVNSAKAKSAKHKTKASPVNFLRQMTKSPNFNSQLMVIVFSLLSDNVPLARPIENVTSTIDKVRNISEVLTSTMQSVKVASEVPTQIRRLFK